jgi:hypothetical protein
LKYLMSVASIVVISGCGSTNMTPTGPKQEAREANCEFQIFTTAPIGFAEIGAIDVAPGAYGHNVFTDIADFKQEIRPSVCQAGGDAAIAYANGLGMYIKAAILKRMEPRTGDAAPTADAGPAASGGCQYDTQCKGDRVCVKGECVAPTSAPVPAPAPAPAAASAAPTSPVP